MEAIINLPENNPAAVTDDVYKLVLPFVFKYISMKDLLKIRSTNHLWNNVIMADRASDGLVFKVYKCPVRSSIDVFKGLLPITKVRNFHFEELDLESTLFGDPEVFRRFSMGHCLTMHSLVLSGCSLSTGRFFELLAFCRALKKLTIKNSPSLFKVENGIAIFHWAFCFKAIRENLSNLYTLSISDKILSHRDLWGLARGATHLVNLNVKCDILPSEGVNEVLKSCCNTLKSLKLYGCILPPTFNLEPQLIMGKLEKLNVHFRNKANAGMLNNFLEKCPQLKEMRYFQSDINKQMLSKVHDDKFIHLEISCCNVAKDAFSDSKFENLETLKYRSEHENSGQLKMWDEAFTGLVTVKRPRLTTMELELPVCGSECLKKLQACNYPSLTRLTVANSCDIAGVSLRNIFKTFIQLQSLSLLNCKELGDENLCNKENEEGSLANLKNLTSLNLSGSNVTNRTVEECIIKLKKLEHIILNNTKVGQEGLMSILNVYTTALTSLKAVCVTPSKISCEEFRRLIRLFPALNIDCDVVM